MLQFVKTAVYAYRMNKSRKNWTISKDCVDRLTLLQKEAQRISGRTVSASSLIEKLIMDKTVNPVDRLKAEKRELAKQMNALDEELKVYEESAHELK
jgi:hypothetical protein